MTRTFRPFGAPRDENLEDIEDSIRRVAATSDDIKQFAPLGHPDRLSQTTKIMCDAVDQVVMHSEQQIGQPINELKENVKRAEMMFADFLTNMRAAADHLKTQISEAMGHYEDIVAKMAESPFTPKVNPTIGPKTEALNKDSEPPLRITSIDLG